MEILSVTGGKPLVGTVPIHGAKNSVLPILAGCLLCPGVSVLHNCPNISDVEHTLAILQRLGCRTERTGSDIVIDAAAVEHTDVPGELAAKMRSSVLFLGALTARAGRARLPLPGGCPLGARPIDLHLSALRALGAIIETDDCELHCSATHLHGADVTLPYPSVGATENLLLAAVACHGLVRLHNAAQEPEIGDLIGFLRSAGARIQGSGTSELVIHGGAPLHGTTYTVLPDRIETATYLCAAAAAGGDVTLTQADPDTLLPVLDVLERSGCRISRAASSIRLRSEGRLTAPGGIVTAPYPGFPTDAQAPVMAALLRAKGCTQFVETVFEDRFRHTAQLRKLGADIRLLGDTAIVRGVETLHGGTLLAQDLRGAAALLIAALSCPEKSFILGVKHIKRGYDNPEATFRSLGAQIISLVI